MNKAKALCALTVLALPSVALSDNSNLLGWTYGDLGYLRASSGDDETDAYTIKGSIGFLEQYHFQVEWVDGDLGAEDYYYDDDVEFDGYRLVLGAHPQLSPTTQGVLEVHWSDYEADSDDAYYDFDYDGWSLAAGFRHLLTDRLEVNALAIWNEGEWEADYYDEDEDYTAISVRLGGRYHFTDNLSAGVTVVTDDPVVMHEDSLTFDVRWQFADPF